MDSKGSSLPSMPEPANLISMKQPPESLGGRKVRSDMSADSVLLMDKAAAQLAATLQDSVLQKMVGNGHTNHGRLKDLTSRMLNGDQDKIPKLCAPEGPVTNGTHQRKPKIRKSAKPPRFEPCCADGTTDLDVAAAADGVLADVMTKTGRTLKTKRQRNLGSTAVPATPPVSTPMDESTAAAETQEKPPVPALMEGREESPLQIRFSVGDVVWTKVSGYPWWPCVVTTDPELNEHTKPKQKANSRAGLLYHVQYFGDAPERGYIFEKSIVYFKGEEQYQELCQGNKQPSSRVIHKKTVPLVPRKLRTQWNLGLIQAKEAVGLLLEDRLAKFTYVYDDDGPRLNPYVLEKLRPEERRLEEDPGEEASRLSPVPPGPAAAAAASTTAHPRDDTSAGGKTPAPRAKNKMGEKRKRELVGSLSKKKAKAPSSSGEKDQGHPQPASQDSTTSAPETDTELPAPQRKSRKSQQQSPPATKVVKRRSSKLDSSTGEISLPLLPTAPATKGLKKKRTSTNEPSTDSTIEQKKSSKRPQTEAAAEEKDQQPKKKRKMSKDAEKQKGSGSEGRPDSPNDSLDGTKKGERSGGAKKFEFVCPICEESGEDLLPCEGQCFGMFHLHCLGLSDKPQDKLLCPECISGVHSCFSCKKSEGEMRRCNVHHCGKFYHEACARLNTLSTFDNKGLRCALHTCLSCHYSSRSKPKSTKGKMMRCLRCPVAYHLGDLCVAAGSEMLTPNAIICTNHFNAKKGYSHHSHVNVSWCFVCSKGGSLLCCESCPAAFHPDCLNITMPDGSWFCNDCRAGKKPKYRDIIWVKLGTYRWWPAEIHHPRNIPTNIQHLRHEIGEFPVYFFGSKDYFWTHQGRVFPYMEGDRGSKYQKSGIGKVFKTAILEAEAQFKENQLKREAKEAQENNRKPPPYKFIKINRPCGKVQVYTADVSEMPKCNCKPADERPCGFESECLNRMLLYECHPQVCPSGERCCNQDFTKRLYPETKIIKTIGKGWGLVSLREIKKGEFVNEYIGELIDEEECRARIRYNQENDISHFYMLTIDKDRIIDAGPKGNYSRFMNHSCQPNCETQKWTVNGDTRVGLFAVCDIPAGTELTFNYNLDCLSNEKTVCRCEAPNCSGFLGDRPKNSNGPSTEGKKPKKKQRRRRSEGKKKSDDDCFRCRDGGQLVLCDKKGCAKAYHLSCLDLTKRPFGRWDCPWHHCDVCGKNSEAFCQLCPNSFCKAHREGALRLWPPTGQLCCLEHEEQEGGAEDPAQAPVAPPVAAAAPHPSKGSSDPEVPETQAAPSEPATAAPRPAKGSRKNPAEA